MGADIKGQCRFLVEGVLRDLANIDGHIQEASKHWSLERIAKTDKILLRVAIFELLHTAQPLSVILNNAINLAKEYGSESSGAFVNGLLDTIAKKLRA